MSTRPKLLLIDNYDSFTLQPACKHSLIGGARSRCGVTTRSRSTMRGVSR
jgi:anthranilate/para-aminobenzoate synthase component II